MARALSIYLGTEATRKIGEQGWSPELFSLLLGASGGPKWFILGHLDRVLFGDFLQRSDRPLSVLGSSIGSWRHACLAMPDPVGAIEQLQRGYMYQRYATKPTAAEVSAVSVGILEGILGSHGDSYLTEHPRIHTHIVTARGRGPSASPNPALLASGMGMAAIGNTLNRQLLGQHFQRVVFHNSHEPQPMLSFNDFNTHYARLSPENVKQALHASGAIPFVLTGERNITGAPHGQYWDGGIIDYHFDLQQYRGDGLILYPHFNATLIPGWFDKFLPWRKANYSAIENLVLLCPSDEFIAQLPLGKIPDRSDFQKLDEDERIKYWEACVEQSKQLAAEFTALINQRDPLEGTEILR